MKAYNGIPASDGLGIGRIKVFHNDENPQIPCFNITGKEISHEWERFQQALTLAIEELKSLQAKNHENLAKEQADIFFAHLLMLEDDDYHRQIREKLKKNMQNIEWVIWELSQELSQKIMMAGDPVLRERSVDITDISKRLIDCLQKAGTKCAFYGDLNGEVILAANNLMPSDTLCIDKAKIKGITLDEGSKTCHTAIIARALKIPLVLGLSGFSKEVKDGEIAALNGTTGLVVTSPGQKTLDQMKNQAEEECRQNSGLKTLCGLPAETTDGRRVTLKANIGLPEEAETALNYGAEGIGLYRSEFLFIQYDKMTDEEVQFKVYSKVLKTMGNLPVTIRTADIGADKIFDSLKAKEKNPLLGLRGLRLSLSNPNLFRVQLRAILRASVFGNVRIMFPMVPGIGELELALKQLETARSECDSKGQQYAKEIPAGIMIEIPSAAMIADILGEKSCFFSIGTNDLIQYSLAADRENEKVSNTADAYHPALFRLIKKTIEGAHANGIKAAICGELAGDPDAAEILLGLGLDEFSMTASSIPLVKEKIRSASFEHCKKLAEKVLQGKSSEENRKIIFNE